MENKILEKKVELLLPDNIGPVGSFFYHGLEHFKNNQSRYSDLAINSPELVEYKKLLYSLPSLTFEFGFIDGSTENVRNGYKAGAKLIPDKMIPIDILISVANGEDSTVEAFNLQLNKDSDYFDWQQWRLEGINSGHYTKPNFTRYNNFAFRFATDEIYFSSNNKVESGAHGIKINFPVSETDSVELEGEVVDYDENESDQNFHYIYKIKLNDTLDQSLVDKLNQFVPES